MLRAIALKRTPIDFGVLNVKAEIIMLRAIALKPGK